MTKPTLVVLALLVAAGGVRAQGPAQPATPATTGTTAPAGMDPKLWELLNLDSGANKALPESAAPGSPIVGVYGHLGSGPASEPERIAREFVTRFGTVLGFPPGADLAQLMALVRPAKRVATGTTLTYAPAVRGVPYVRAKVIFSVNAAGRLVAVSGRYRPVGSPTMGSLSGRDAVRRAIELAQRAHGVTELTGDGALREYLEDVEGGGIQHFYKVEVVMGRPASQRSLTLGPSGDLISDEIASESDADASVFPNYPQLVAEVKPLPGVLNPAEVGAAVGTVFGLGGTLVGGVVGALMDYKVHGWFFWSDSSHGESASDFHGHFRYDPFQGDSAKPMKANPMFLECNVYHHLSVARKKLLGWGCEEADDDHFFDFDVWRPKYKSRWDELTKKDALEDNAQFAESDSRLEFAASNPGKEERSPAMDAGVIYHEYGHQIHSEISSDRRTGGDAAGRLEARAISEGFGDAIAAAITNDPVKSLWWYGTIKRRADTALKVSDVTPCHSGAPVNNTEIHMAGQVFSGAFWDLKGKLRADDAMKILIAGLRKARTPHTFAHVGQGMLDGEAELFGGAKSADVVAVLAGRGMTAAPITASSAGH
jgi:hypothetical protein